MEEEEMREEELSANHRAEGRTHPFRLKILLVYHLHRKFAACGPLKGQFDFSTHSSETHKHSMSCNSKQCFRIQEVTSQRWHHTHVPICRVNTYFS